MEDKLQAYRQPLVTATGIILGFILNFASSFVKAESTIGEGLAYLIGVCILVGIICLIIVLSRILKMDYPREKATTYYQVTLNLFILGLSIAFLGVMLDMITNFMND